MRRDSVYQDEFYRALHQVLGFMTRVSSEWSGGGRGIIDFRITDVGWGIELVREGDMLSEHWQRFMDNGRYAPWITSGWMTDWLIIDFRTSQPPHMVNFQHISAFHLLISV
jgi:hypothetical protein